MSDERREGKCSGDGHQRDAARHVDVGESDDDGNDEDDDSHDEGDHSEDDDSEDDGDGSDGEEQRDRRSGATAEEVDVPGGDARQGRRVALVGQGAGYPSR